jgi:glycerophosphoryl diester phosphodiesterase
MEHIALAVLTLAFAAPAVSHAIEVHGHRGARAAYPENTLPAFRHAIEAGVDYIELDVRLTKDNHVVVHHDPELSSDRCLDGEGRSAAPGTAIRSLTLEELRRFDCGARANPEFPHQRTVPGTRVPTLHEVFDLVRSLPHPNARVVGIHIELKAHPSKDFPSAKEYASLLVPILSEHGMLDRTVMQSFNLRLGAIAKRLARKLGRKGNPKVISPPASWISRPLVAILHALKMRVVPWTVNDPEGWEKMIGLGVDGIVTDDPEGLIRYLRNRGDRR